MLSTVPRLLGQPEWPAVPASVEELRLPRAVLSDLILRYLWLHGSATITTLQRELKLPFAALESLFHEFRQEQLVGVKEVSGHDYTVVLSGSGRAVAAARGEVCRYVGPAPVSLSDYQRVVRAQAPSLQFSREQLRATFHDLVLSDELLDRLGPSLIAHSSLFLYGETGSGKTSIAQRLLRIYKDPVLIPYAVEVDGQIISVLDPQVHRFVRFTGDSLDARWAVCQRPSVKVGGELSAAMLELRRDDTTGVFVAPCQMKANNGVLVIDDFGRQLLAPRDLLNRWIVPLDQRSDLLTLASGVKFPVPFELLLVFSTNLDPSGLVDEAFLRRFHTKVYVHNPSAAAFDEIFERVLAAEGLTCDAAAVARLRQRCLTSGSGALRACFPVDICRLIRAVCAYESLPVSVTPDLIDRAVDLYFARSPENPAAERVKHVAGSRRPISKNTRSLRGR